MSAEIELLKKKAFAISKSIEKMSAKECNTLPSEIFGHDYNQLRNMIAELEPHLGGVLPPAVKFGAFDENGVLFSMQRYAEIHCFCCQIVELLSPCEPPAP